MLPSAPASPWPDAVETLRAAGFTVAALTPREPAMSVGAFVATDAARGRVAVLLGTEGAGLSDETMRRADVRVRIPMDAAVSRGAALDSLNVATAAGIVLHRLHERRRDLVREGD